jgi:hypothetical protein
MDQASEPSGFNFMGKNIHSRQTSAIKSIKTLFIVETGKFPVDKSKNLSLPPAGDLFIFVP